MAMKMLGEKKNKTEQTCHCLPVSLISWSTILKFDSKFHKNKKIAKKHDKKNQQ